MATDTFFDEFQPVSKADWLAQVARDLKDRLPDSLDWQSQAGFTVSPLVHADDFDADFIPVESEPNNWEVVEGVYAADPVTANRISLDALEGGAEGLSGVSDQSAGWSVSQPVAGWYLSGLYRVAFYRAGSPVKSRRYLGHCSRLPHPEA
jgi:hypothetical protein